MVNPARLKVSAVPAVVVHVEPRVTTTEPLLAAAADRVQAVVAVEKPVRGVAVAVPVNVAGNATVIVLPIVCALKESPGVYPTVHVAVAPCT